MRHRPPWSQTPRCTKVVKTHHHNRSEIQELLNWNCVLAYNLERMVQIPCDELNAAFLDTLIIQHDIKKERLANTKRFQRCRSSSKLLEMAICEDKKSY